MENMEKYLLTCVPLGCYILVFLRKKKGYEGKEEENGIENVLPIESKNTFQGHLYEWKSPSLTRMNR